MTLKYNQSYCSIFPVATSMILNKMGNNACISNRMENCASNLHNSKVFVSKFRDKTKSQLPCGERIVMSL